MGEGLSVRTASAGGERAIFADGMPNNVVPANSSRVMTFDVWHNVASGADVPNDLTLNIGYELA